MQIIFMFTKQATFFDFFFFKSLFEKKTNQEKKHSIFEFTLLDTSYYMINFQALAGYWCDSIAVVTWI